MKKLVLLALFVLGTATASFSNEPPTIDGTYVTINSYAYSYEAGKWYELDTAYQMLEISIAEGVVRLGDNTYTILRMKKKDNKKMGSIDFEFRLANSKGEWLSATFVIFKREETGAKLYSQFYLSNAKMEVSYDLHH